MNWHAESCTFDYSSRTRSTQNHSLCPGRNIEKSHVRLWKMHAVCLKRHGVKKSKWLVKTTRAFFYAKGVFFAAQQEERTTLLFFENNSASRYFYLDPVLDRHWKYRDPRYFCDFAKLARFFFFFFFKSSDARLELRSKFWEVRGIYKIIRDSREWKRAKGESCSKAHIQWTWKRKKKSIFLAKKRGILTRINKRGERMFKVSGKYLH